MAGVKKNAGPTSRRAAANLKRIRQRKGLTAAEVARRAVVYGSPILDTAITKTETGSRRMDIDDLMVLAAVLDVSPNELLLPETLAPMVTLSAKVELTPGMFDSLGRVWAWATGEQPLNPGSWHDQAEFALHSRPHRFVLSAPQDAPSWQAVPRMVQVVTDLLSSGVSPWDVRTAFEQAMVGALNSMDAVREPPAAEPYAEQARTEADDGQG